MYTLLCLEEAICGRFFVLSISQSYTLCSVEDASDRKKKFPNLNLEKKFLDDLEAMGEESNGFDTTCNRLFLHERGFNE
jgi:hypothetical protein